MQPTPSIALSRLLPLGTTLCLLSAPAWAQVTSVGPFTGDRSEGYETQSSGAGGGHSGFQPCVVGRVFGSTADLCTTGGAAQLLVTSGWSFRCVIDQHAGSYFTGSAGEPVEFRFDTDVEEFGTYLGTNSWQTGSAETCTVNFYDGSGTLIDSVVANVTDDCTWTWNGWRADAGAVIARVEIINSAFSGGFIDIDSSEVSDSSGIGTNYCNANPNSTGVPAVMSASGSTSVGANSFHLHCSDMPLDAYGYFLNSQSQGFVMNPGGSQGNLCLGNPVGPFNQLVQNSGGTGKITIQADLTNFPTPTGFVSVVMGDTWNFTCWYRDSDLMGNATSNFADGLEVQF